MISLNNNEKRKSQKISNIAVITKQQEAIFYTENNPSTMKKKIMNGKPTESVEESNDLTWIREIVFYLEW